MLVSRRSSSLVVLCAAFVALSAVIRTVLLVKALPGLDGSLVTVAKVYGVGFFFDCVTFGYAAAPVVVLAALLPDRVYNGRAVRALVGAGFFLLAYGLLFDGVAEYVFWDEFGTRFNFIAVDYLVYTQEVLSNIRESYPVGWILAALVPPCAALSWASRRALARGFGHQSRLGPRLAWAAAFAAVPVLSFALVDQSLTAVSRNNYASELAGNGLYDLFAAFRNNELDYANLYATRGEAASLRRLRELLAPSRGRAGAARAPKRLNVVVVVEESLSAEYLGCFGNRARITPNLDRLAKESLVFTRVYATGTRTVRGLEAVALSLPPLPGASLVKRPRCEGFSSWGTLMRGAGYDAKFFYGGYGYFDNMNRFFGGNGFGIVDRADFARSEVTFSNAWGVCDEDLFAKVIREAEASAGSGKPFFSVVMTTSNHRPYTYPDGRIDIPSHKSRKGAVKYADYALGAFLEKARAQPWFADTLFVLVADHCASSAGKMALPVKNYEIPLFFYAPAHVAPGRIDTLASQIDVAPTVLGLLGMDRPSWFFGRDLLNRDPSDGRAFLSTYQKLGLLEGDRLVVLAPGQKVDEYAVARESGDLSPVPAAGPLVEDAIAWYEGAYWVDRRGLNRLSP